MAHVVLAQAFVAYPVLSLAHATLVVLVGAIICLRQPTAEIALLLAGYVACCEVLWRMTGGSPFWEFSKYATILFLLLALTRLPSERTRTGNAAIVFVALLLPSIPMTLSRLADTAAIRRDLSFSLSGPICLAVAAAVFSQVRPRDYSVKTAAQWMAFPIIGIAGITLTSTARAGDIVFMAESNMITSGHYGPNQVSGILGFGALLLFVIALISRDSRFRIVTTLAAVWLTAQAVLTLSRGGVVSAGLAVFVFILHALPNRRARLAFTLAGALFVGLITWVVIPGLNRFTGGTLEERYSDWDTSGRTAVAEGDLELWSDNLLLGVGPGMSPRLRDVRPGTAAHTEFTRLLAEHGLLGAAALLILIAMATRAYLRAPSSLASGFAAACVVWSVSEMLHSSMRLSATAFAFGLGMLGVDRLRESKPIRQAGPAQGAPAGEKSTHGVGAALPTR